MIRLADTGARFRRNAPLAAAVTLAILVIGLNLLIHDAESLSKNMAAAARFLVSLQFLYLAAGSSILLLPRVSTRQFHAGIFLLAAFYFAQTYWSFLDIMGMAGDNICQVAYFNVLSRLELAGSIGASYPKPGQILLLGLVNRISAFGGAWVFKLFISLVMAACVGTLSAISARFGGRAAGIASLFVSIWAFLPEFIAGSYSIYLIPVLFGGIFLYFGEPARKSLGRALLASSILFHIQAITVLAVLWLLLLAWKEWKELALLSRDCLISLALWFGVIYRVQGDLSRFNAGTAVGYLASGSSGPESALGSRLHYLFQEIASQIAATPHHPLLFVLILIGIVGVAVYGSRVYLSVFSGMVILVLHVLFLQGELTLERHFAIFFAFGCSFGIGSIARFAGSRDVGRATLVRGCVAASACLLVPLADFSMLQTTDTLRSSYGDNYVVRLYVEDARGLLEDPALPRTTRLMTEDDLLYPIVVMAPDRFKRLSALQNFNVQPEDGRRRMLEHVDYVWIELNDHHAFYYLPHLASRDWATDPFRVMVLRILENHGPSSLYGFRFTMVDANQDRLILKVDPEPSPVATGGPPVHER